MANTKPIGIAYADPDFDSLSVGGSAVNTTAVTGVTAGTATASKAVILDANKAVDVVRTASLRIGASGSETAVTASGAELNLIDGTVAGTAVASKALALGADKNVDTIAVADGGLKLGAGAGTAVTATAAELNKMDGIPASVTVVVTTPGASGTCDAAFTFKDAAGATIAIPVALPFYLSGVDGLSITGAITSILAADTPVGAVGVLTTGQSGLLVTTAAGLGSVKLTGANATTYYITFIGLGGRLIVSPALLTKA